MDLRSAAREVVQQLQTQGFRAYWVGGCVRDGLRGIAPADYDVATSAHPDAVAALFPQTIGVGKEFGVQVVRHRGFQYQVATFRGEGQYTDGRHPDRVTFGDALADARRRDFTINGLYYDPVREQLHDWVGGQADLAQRLVRTIGAPHDRFAEDHLRLLRAVRFAAQLDFVIEPATFAALRGERELIRTVSAERVREEFLRLFRPPHAARGLTLLRDSGLLEILLPEIFATIDCEQSPEYHPEGSVYNHILRMLGLVPASAPPALVWAVLLHDVGKVPTATRDADGAIHFYGHERVGAEMAEQLLERLRFSRREIAEITASVRNHMQFKDVPNMRKATLRRILLRPSFSLELELHRLDALGSHGDLRAYDRVLAEANELAQQPALHPPLITGDDLLQLGMQPGRQLGEILAEIRDKQLQGELATAEQARDWAKRQLNLAAPR